MGLIQLPHLALLRYHAPSKQLQGAMTMRIRLTGFLVHGRCYLFKVSLLPWLLWVGVPAMGADYFYTVKPGDHPWNLAERFLQRPEMGLQLGRSTKYRAIRN